MKPQEFKALTAMAADAIRAKCPGIVFVLIVTDDDLVNMASNAGTKDEVADLLIAASKQFEEQDHVRPWSVQ